MRGSEPALKWQNWNGPRECDVCGQKLTLERLGEYRQYWEDGKVIRQVVWCVDHRGGRNGARPT